MRATRTRSTRRAPAAAGARPPLEQPALALEGADVGHVLDRFHDPSVGAVGDAQDEVADVQEPLGDRQPELDGVFLAGAAFAAVMARRFSELKHPDYAHSDERRWG